MTKSTDIWFPFYIGDYIADTMHLSAEEHGAYLLLIIHYWKNQKPIKNEPKTIQNIAKIKFKKLSNVLAFFEEKNGEFTHSRIEKEIAKARKNKELKSEAGKKGMEKRYNRTVTDVITEPQQNTYQTPNPSPSPTESIIIKDNNTKSIPPQYSDAFEEFWKEYPKNGASKKEAYKSFNKITGVTQNDLIATIRQYSGYCQATATPIAHATTWLNQERWTINYRDLYRSEKRGSQQSNGEGFAEQLQVTQALAEALIADRNNRRSSESV